MAVASTVEAMEAAVKAGAMVAGRVAATAAGAREAAREPAVQVAVTAAEATEEATMVEATGVPKAEGWTEEARGEAGREAAAQEGPREAAQRDWVETAALTEVVGRATTGQMARLALSQAELMASAEREEATRRATGGMAVTSRVAGEPRSGVVGAPLAESTSRRRLDAAGPALRPVAPSARSDRPARRPHLRRERTT